MPGQDAGRNAFTFHFDQVFFSVFHPISSTPLFGIGQRLQLRRIGSLDTASIDNKPLFGKHTYTLDSIKHLHDIIQKWKMVYGGRHRDEANMPFSPLHFNIACTFLAHIDFGFLNGIASRLCIEGSCQQLAIYHHIPTIFKPQIIPSAI